VWVPLEGIDHRHTQRRDGMRVEEEEEEEEEEVFTREK